MIALFVLKLSAGITLMWWLMPRAEVTDGFFRIQMRLLLGTTVLTTLLLTGSTTWQSSADARGSSSEMDSSTAAHLRSGTIPQPEAGDPAGTSHPTKAGFFASSPDAVAKQLQWLQILAALVAYPGSIFWALGRRTPGTICIWLLGLLCLGSVALHSLTVPSRAAVWLQAGSDGASVMVLGAMLTAMLLGHWYLTTPGMSIRPLWWFARILLIAAGLRMAFSAMALWQFGFESYDLTRGLWLLMRVAGGGVIPAVVAVLMQRILKYRNTQSATGVLFAGLILVFMGEMTAALLERDVQIPY